MRQRIVLVEDDERLGEQVIASLREAGYETAWFRDGREATPAAVQGASLLILDLMLPGAHGFDVLRNLRQQSDVPVLVLSARNETLDKVRALKLGADDYVTKPFWPEELIARVAARLRRPVMQRATQRRIGGLEIDLDGRSVSADAAPVELTRAEFEILAALARRPGAAVSRAALVTTALDPEREGGERTLDVHVSRLRKKLGTCGRQITTVWGVGYRLSEP